MGLNIQKGNMYHHVTHTWNAVKGACEYSCTYCFMKRFKQHPIRLVESEFKTDLGAGNFIFVGSSTDMFAENVPAVWIEKTLEHCRRYPANRYLFQSKNPDRFLSIPTRAFPPKAHFATTIESNREYEGLSAAPPAISRIEALKLLHEIAKIPISVTIEPILDFDFDVLMEWLGGLPLEWVVIGADSKGHHLPEPSAPKVRRLIEEVGKFTAVIQKKNLRRLLEAP